MLKPLRIYITGEPGVGKTTLLLKIVNELSRKGINVSGFYCPEVRERGKRVGFKIKSFDEKIEDWLANIYGESDIKIGKYNVILTEETIKKLEEEIFKADILAIDEIGPMELSIPKLKGLIDKILQSNYNLIAVVHRRIKLTDGKVYVVTRSNRELLVDEILNYILASLHSSK